MMLLITFSFIFVFRWFKDAYKMETINTTNILPVDLNAILCAVEFTLATLYEESMLEPSYTASKFQKLAEKRLSDELFWNETTGLWCDYNLTLKKQSSEFYASAFFPLWLLSTFAKKPSINTGRAFETIKELGVLGYQGGLPTSLIDSGEQWDFPNAWPPLQHVAVQGLDPSGANHTTTDNMHQAGKDLARRFLENAYISWKNMTYKKVLDGQTVSF